MIIYKITNLINNKIYIGQTVSSIEKRWGQHWSDSRSKGVLIKAIKKYGKENFKIEEIDKALTIHDLNEKETYWIEHYKSTDPIIGYNLMSGGANQRHDERSKKHMSDIMKVRSHMIGKSGNLHPFYGAKHTPETRLKMKEARKFQKRNPPTEETKALMRQKALGRKRTIEAIEKQKLTVKLKKIEKAIMLSNSQSIREDERENLCQKN